MLKQCLASIGFAGDALRGGWRKEIQGALCVEP